MRIIGRRLFYRNVRARDNLELFLIAAVSSLLILRFALYLSGYPQVGGGSLHIAHMLYGGLLMLVAIVLMVSFLGARIQRLASLLGGIGFGIFIDELGKFITKDNNYFFRPTVGIIYAIFIILYLAFNFVSRDQKLSSREYQLNALNQFEEVVLNDLDKAEKARIHTLLKSADANSPLTKALQNLLTQVETVPETPNVLSRWLNKIASYYDSFWKRRSSQRIVGLIFIIESLVFLVVAVASIFHSFDSIKSLIEGHNSYGTELIVGQLFTTLIAAVYVVLGAIKLPASRLEAFEQFKRATLITLFLTEFFIFTRVQFGAMPGFIVNLGLLAGLQFALYQEHRATG